MVTASARSWLPSCRSTAGLKRRWEWQTFALGSASIRCVATYVEQLGVCQCCSGCVSVVVGVSVL